jgi:hypothetical protein
MHFSRANLPDLSKIAFFVECRGAMLKDNGLGVFEPEISRSTKERYWFRR